MDPRIKESLEGTKSATPESSLYQLLMLMEHVWGRHQEEATTLSTVTPDLVDTLVSAQGRDDFFREFCKVISHIEREDVRAGLLSFLRISFHPTSFRFLLRYLSNEHAIGVEDFRSAALSTVDLLGDVPKSELRSVISQDLLGTAFINALNAKATSGNEREAQAANLLLSSIKNVVAANSKEAG
jgi:hypothetical protein